jgi:hypothetical protein
MKKINWEKARWTSLRFGWPLIEDVTYLIKDSRYGIYGEAYYNGWDFNVVYWDKSIHTTLKDSELIVTHWGDPECDEDN